MRIKELSKQEGIMLKGIAILLVIMHNYCHEFSYAVETNEFTWIKDNITLFNHHLLSLDNNLIVHISLCLLISHAIPYLMSFYGLSVLSLTKNTKILEPILYLFRNLHTFIT